MWLTDDVQTRLYAPDGGEAFARNLELSGEPFEDLTSWVTREAPGIENLSHQKLWDWSMKRDIFRYSYLQGLLDCP